jgi:hypothetical protein
LPGASRATAVTGTSACGCCGCTGCAVPQHHHHPPPTTPPRLRRSSFPLSCQVHAVRSQDLRPPAPPPTSTTTTVKHCPPPTTTTVVEHCAPSTTAVEHYAPVPLPPSLHGSHVRARTPDGTLARAQARRIQRFFRRRWQMRRWAEVSAARCDIYRKACLLRTSQWHARVRALRAAREALCAAAGVRHTLRPCFRPGRPVYPGGVNHAGGRGRGEGAEAERRDG